MPQRITTTDHRWIGASTVVLDDSLARTAYNRQAVKLPELTRIDVLEVYCAECRRPYEDVATLPCESAAGNEHLRGGPIGTRAKRTPAAAPPAAEVANLAAAG